jgi:hypothetical protein
LPLFESADGERRVAAQSELLALDETFFLLLCRGSGNGYGTGGATSRYRSINLLLVALKLLRFPARPSATPGRASAESAGEV